MRRAIAIVAVSVALVACGADEHAPNHPTVPARMERVNGAARIRLTLDAARRIGLTTAVARGLPDGRVAVPYSALLYDAIGGAAVYIGVDVLVYTREPVTVERVEGDEAILTSGPPPGTPLVSVGAVELSGVEFGVAGE